MENEQTPYSNSQETTRYQNGLNGQTEKPGMTTIKENFVSMKSRLSGQANELGQQLSNKIDIAREKTSQTLHSTSQRLDQVANYLQDNSTEDMMQGVTELVRNHPGKSLLAFLGIGFLLGRSLR